MTSPSPRFIEMLRSELTRLEENPGVDSHDPKNPSDSKPRFCLLIAEFERHQAEAA